MAARSKDSKPKPDSATESGGPARTTKKVSANQLMQSAYPHLPRNVVIVAKNAKAIQEEYHNKVTAPTVLAELLNKDSGLVPFFKDGFYLFQPKKKLQTEAFVPLHAYLASPQPSLAAAEAVRDDVQKKINEMGETSPIASVYVQGLFGPSGVMNPRHEREIGRQDYLLPARYGGVDALHAWLSGATGVGETIYLLESGCWIDHPDFEVSGGGNSVTHLVGPLLGPRLHWLQHGTGVAGIMAATCDTDSAQKGIVGIAYEAKVKVAFASPGVWDPTSQLSNLVTEVAASSTPAGPIIVLAMCCMPTPGNVWLPAEIDSFVRDAVDEFIKAGAVVIEPAGNSDADLDDYMTLPSSGAIIVGSSRSYDPYPKTLLSNYSSKKGFVSLFSWGENVFTSSVGLKDGAGDPPSPGDCVSSYASMAGTSSASAIIAGVAACVQSKIRKSGATPLNCDDMLKELLKGANECLAGSGIGFQPDLKGIL